MALNRLYTAARLVETIIEDMLASNRTKPEVCSTPYQNGREKGFVFHTYGDDGVVIAVFVAENRNSDDTQCVTSSETTMFNAEEYEKARHFLYNNAHGAAKHVVETLLGKHWYRSAE